MLLGDIIRLQKHLVDGNQIISSLRNLECVSDWTNDWPTVGRDVSALSCESGINATVLTELTARWTTIQATMCSSRWLPGVIIARPRWQPWQLSTAKKGVSTVRGHWTRSCLQSNLFNQIFFTCATQNSVFMTAKCPISDLVVASTLTIDVELRVACVTLFDVDIKINLRMRRSHSSEYTHTWTCLNVSSTHMRTCHAAASSNIQRLTYKHSWWLFGLRQNEFSIFFQSRYLFLLERSRFAVLVEQLPFAEHYFCLCHCQFVRLHLSSKEVTWCTECAKDSAVLQFSHQPHNTIFSYNLNFQSSHKQYNIHWKPEEEFFLEKHVHKVYTVNVNEL